MLRVLALVAVLGGTAAHAEPEPDEPATMLQSPAIAAIMAVTKRPSLDTVQPKALDVVKAWTGIEPCPEATGVEIDRLAIATVDAVIDKSIKAAKLRNAWTTTARPAGCKSPVAAFRLLVMQGPDDGYRVVPLGRGESLAWPSLTGDLRGALGGALAAACFKEKVLCSKNVTLLPSRVTARSPDLGEPMFGVRYAGNWTEVWPVKTGAATVDIVWVLTADGKGGAYWSTATPPAK